MIKFCQLSSLLSAFCLSATPGAWRRGVSWSLVETQNAAAQCPKSLSVFSQAPGYMCPIRHRLPQNGHLEPSTEDVSPLQSSPSARGKQPSCDPCVVAANQKMSRWSTDFHHTVLSPAWVLLLLTAHTAPSYKLFRLTRMEIMALARVAKLMTKMNYKSSGRSLYIYIYVVELCFSAASALAHTGTEP